MEMSRDLLLILHFIAMAGLLGGLLASQSKLNKGVLHSALLALVTGLGLVGIRYSLVDSYPDQYEEINHSVVGIKLVILIFILVLGYLNAKKQVFPKRAWLAMVAHVPAGKSHLHRALRSSPHRFSTELFSSQTRWVATG